MSSAHCMQMFTQDGPKHAVVCPDLPRYGFGRGFARQYIAWRIQSKELQWSLPGNTVTTTSTRALEASPFGFPSVLRPVSQQHKSDDFKRFTFFDCVWETCNPFRCVHDIVSAVPRHIIIRRSVLLPNQNDVKDKPAAQFLNVTTQKFSLPLVASALDSSHASEPDTEGKVGEVVDLDFSDLRLGR